MADQTFKIIFNNKLTNISDLKVADLKIELKRRGESTSGNKKDLHDRLKNYLIKEEQNSSLNNDDNHKENELNESKEEKINESMNIESNVDNNSSIQTPNKRTSSDIEDEVNNQNKKVKHNESIDTNNVGEIELQINVTNVSFNDTRADINTSRKSRDNQSESRSRSRSTSKQRERESKSPSMESFKSESVLKEVPMSGDRNRFSRSKSPKARWHNIKDNEELNEDKVDKEVNLELEKSEVKNLKEKEEEEKKIISNELIKEDNIENKIDDNNLNLGTNDVVNNGNPSSSSIATTTTSIELTVTNEESVSGASTIPTKTQRKRKWLNNDSLKTLSNNESVTISSDTLKTFLIENKSKEPETPTSETLNQISNDEKPSTNGFSRTVIPNDEQQEENNVDHQQTLRTVIIGDKDEAENEIIRNNERVLVESLEETSTKSSRKDELPTKPATNIIHIDNLTRPFTLNQLKELLSKYGSYDEEKFWINNVKSHCYVAYENIESAKAAREALHNTQWPQSNPKTLVVDFATEDDLHTKLNLETKSTKLSQNSALRPEYREALHAPKITQERSIEGKSTNKRDENGRSDDREREMTKDRRDKERDRSDRREVRRDEKERDRRSPNQSDKRKRDERITEQQKETKPVREWDLPKLRGSRSRSRDISMERKRKRDEKRKSDGKERESKKEPKEQVEEQPVKMLDDLFKKTKATPCIYWLPLTDEQILQREQEAEKRQQERERKRLEKENQNDSLEQTKNEQDNHRKEDDEFNRKSDMKRPDDNYHHTHSEIRNKQRRNDNDDYETSRTKTSSSSARNSPHNNNNNRR